MGDCHARGLPLCKHVQTDATYTLTISFHDFCSATSALVSLTFTSAPPSQSPISGEARVSSTSISTHVRARHQHQAHTQAHSINQSLNACSANPGAIVGVFQPRAALAESSTVPKAAAKIAMAAENSSSSPQAST